MNPIMSTLAQVIFVLPAHLALKLLDLAQPQAGGTLAIHRGDFLLCSLFVAGWWAVIVHTVRMVTGLA